MDTDIWHGFCLLNCYLYMLSSDSAFADKAIVGCVITDYHTSPYDYYLI